MENNEIEKIISGKIVEKYFDLVLNLPYILIEINVERENIWIYIDKLSVADRAELRVGNRASVRVINVRETEVGPFAIATEIVFDQVTSTTGEN